MTKIAVVTMVSLVVAVGSLCAIAADNADTNEPASVVGDSNSSGEVVILEHSYGPGFCGCDFSGEGAINFLDFAAFAPWWGYDDTCWINSDWCDKTDLNHDGYVDYEDLLIIVGCWLDEDMSAPTPNPMEWDLSLDEGGFDGKPRQVHFGPGTFDWEVTMRADPNTADDTGFDFYFYCVSRPDLSSGWLTFPGGPPYEYTRPIGQTQLTSWRVMARDRSINQDENYTDWSTPDEVAY